MTKRKKRKKSFCEDFSNFQLPPCAKFLGSANPFVKDDKIIYRNNNRLYLFLSFNTKTSNGKAYNPIDPSTYNLTGVGNLQIELYFFIIGLFINEVQKGKIKESMKSIIMYNMWKQSADGKDKNTVADYNYWSKEELKNSVYYPGVPINLVRKIAAKIVSNMFNNS